MPIRLIAATRDGAVDRKNRDLALADYTNPSPHQLDETHASIKLPVDHADIRYRVLARDLQTALIRTFNRLCKTAVSGDTSKNDRDVVLREMARRYGKLIRPRLEKLRVPRRFQEEVEDEFLILMASFGASPPAPASSAADKALAVLQKRYRDWQ